MKPTTSTANRMAKQPITAPQSKEALDLVRRNVRDLLLQSPAFRALPSTQQQEIANHTVQIGSYLAEPEGIRVNEQPPADPYAVGLAGPVTGSARPGRASDEGVFTAQAASEGARVAGALLQAVNFPDFVAGLIKGVFHSIVQASIEQMEAYGRLVADVAKTLNQFRDENVSVNQGRDHLVDQFPDLFTLEMDTGAFGDESSGPRVRLRDGADEEEALRRVNGSLPLENGAISSLDDESIEEKLVPAARTQLATSRQQLLATMVLMGINRIVVTDGKISAKVMYDFQARDNFRYQKSATQFDYAKDAYGNLQTVRSGQSESEREGNRGSYRYSRDKDKVEQERDGGSYYAKGSYKYTDQPVVTLASASQQATDAALQTRASLAGVVEVNFKSDYLPLEKMADSFQIAMIQNAAQPGQGGRGVATASPPANQQSPSTTTTPVPAT